MNTITVRDATLKLLSLSELRSGEFYIGIPKDRAAPADVLFVASDFGPRQHLKISNECPAAGGAVLVRLYDGYVLRGLADDYSGYLVADVEVTATSRV